METARRATPDDVDRIVELGEAMRTELSGHRGGDMWQRTHDPAHHSAAELVALLGYADDCVLVGCIDDTVVGYAIVRAHALADGSRLGTITEVFVEPDAREVGVGECLLDAAVSWCAAHQCVGVDATALPGSRAAKNFFEGHGFVARSLTMHHRFR